MASQSKFKTRGDFKHKKIPFNLDAVLQKNLQKPLSSIKSGSLVIISGGSGSGKTNFLVNIFECHNDPTSHQKRDLKGCFHNIFIVSPSMSSFKDGNILAKLTNDVKFNSLDKFLENYEDNIDEDEESCVIFDDIGNEIRAKENLNKFKKFIDNRRHKHMTIILLLQSLIQIPPQIRSSVNLIVSFKPKAKNERELLYDLTGMDRKHMQSFYNEIYQEKFDSCLVDLTLTDSNDYLFYRNLFNPIEIISDGPDH